MKKKCMMCVWGYPVNARGNHELNDFAAGVKKETPCENPEAAKPQATSEQKESL